MEELFRHAFFLVFLIATAATPTTTVNLLGVAPLDVSYYKSGLIFWCKDRSKSFPVNHLNDDFCDCVDGTDEPGTSACPNGRFYCNNQKQIPIWVFSSRVNDGICDCCDGSDEYDGKVKCKFTCPDGPVDILVKSLPEDRADFGDHTRNVEAPSSRKPRLKFSSWKQEENNLKETVYKLIDLKALMLLEIVLVVVLLWQFFGWICRQGAIARRRLPR